MRRSQRFQGHTKRILLGLGGLVDNSLLTSCMIPFRHVQSPTFPLTRAVALMQGEAAMVALKTQIRVPQFTACALGVCSRLYICTFPSHPYTYFLPNHQLTGIDHTPQPAQHFTDIHFWGLRPQNQGGGPD
jgi:hypothetical protein